MATGGVRVGAGRNPVLPENKKVGYKIYLQKKYFDQINNLGIGSTFSAKVTDLVSSELARRLSIKPMRFIDLFAGIGGIRIAFEKYGNKCVFSSEIDPYCQKVYFDNFKEKPAGDITKIKSSEIPDFDILAGGFPCQPFSYSGKKAGFKDKTRGTLFFDVLRIIQEKHPKMFLLENVKGLKSHDNGKTMETIIGSLKEAGYQVFWTILDSHNFGVPQKRERWYCVGFDKNVNFEFPKGTDNSTRLRDIVDVNLHDPKLTLSNFEQERIDFHFASKDKRVKHDNSKYAKNTKKGKYGVYSYMKPDGTLRFHIGDVAKTQIQEAYYCSLESIAPAIIAAREPKLWDLRRKLSVDECRKLQGFPDWFVFKEGDLHAKKQLGNSVAVPVIEAIVKNMMFYYNLKD